MTSHHPETLRFYVKEAQAYSVRNRSASGNRLDAFLSLLPQDASVLELGCGAGADAGHMIERGYTVRATDGSAAMAQQAAKNLGRPVDTLLFEDLDEHQSCDGIWANACLLHVPRAALPGVLQRIFQALRPGGVFYASYKAGKGEGTDSFGRYYNYPTQAELNEFYASQPWQYLWIETGEGSGYDDRPTEWLFATALKPR